MVTVEIDGKVIKLQIVSGALCVVCGMRVCNSCSCGVPLLSETMTLLHRTAQGVFSFAECCLLCQWERSASESRDKYGKVYRGAHGAATQSSCAAPGLTFSHLVQVSLWFTMSQMRIVCQMCSAGFPRLTVTVTSM